MTAYSRVIAGCMYYSTFMASNQLAAMSAAWLRSVFNIQNSNFITILVVLCMLAVIVFIFKRTKDIEKEEHNWYTIVTVTLASLLVSFQSWVGSSEENAFYISISALFLWVFEIYIFFLILRISKSNAQKIEMAMEISLRKNIDESLRLNESNVKEMRVLNHDLKKHFMIMDAFIREEKYDELKAYFEEVSAQTLAPLSSVACGNDIIRMIVNLGVAKALSYGVRLNVKIEAADELTFSDSDLNCLLMNLIDNAIDSCRRCQPSGGEINLRIWQDDNYFYVNIKNPVNAEAEKNKYAEQERGLHGFGSKIVDRIVTKYNGVINRNADDNNLYEVQIALDCNAVQLSDA